MSPYMQFSPFRTAYHAEFPSPALHFSNKSFVDGRFVKAATAVEVIRTRFVRDGADSLFLASSLKDGQVAWNHWASIHGLFQDINLISMFRFMPCVAAEA